MREQTGMGQHSHTTQGSRSRVGTSSGIHPEDQYDTSDDPSMYNVKMPTSSRRYRTQEQETDTTLIREGHFIPGVYIAPDGTPYIPVQRRARAYAGDTQHPRDQTRNTTAKQRKKIPVQKKRNGYWLVVLALGMLLAVLLLWVGNSVYNWCIDVHNDWTYTANFRTYSDPMGQAKKYRCSHSRRSCFTGPIA